MSKRKIGWIGAGKMGLPICRRLKAAGHDVTVLARRPAQAEALAAQGFACAGTIASAVSDADAVFTAVTDDKALSDVVLESGFAPALAKRVGIPP